MSRRSRRYSMRNNAYDVTTMPASPISSASVVPRRGLRSRGWSRHRDAGREPGGLAGPVLHDAGGRDDEEPGVGLGLEHVQAQREGLDGLAQAHVVGEDPAQPVAVQERQPVEALLLVVAQRGFEPGRRRRPARARPAPPAGRRGRPSAATARRRRRARRARPTSSTWNRLIRATPSPVGSASPRASSISVAQAWPARAGRGAATCPTAGSARSSPRSSAANSEAKSIALAVDADLDVEVEPVVAVARASLSDRRRRRAR